MRPALLTILGLLGLFAVLDAAVLSDRELKLMSDLERDLDEYDLRRELNSYDEVDRDVDRRDHGDDHTEEEEDLSPEEGESESVSEEELTSSEEELQRKMDEEIEAMLKNGDITEEELYQQFLNGDLGGEEEEEERSLMDKRGVLSCKEEGEGCRWAPTCCGQLVCYWKKGLPIFAEGECVKCVKTGQRCHRNGQCCTGQHCDRDDRISFHGTCQPRKKAGEQCSSDSMCENECVKEEFYHINGVCN